MTMLLLFWEFFKIGLFSIGGGLATLPFLVNLASKRPDWLTMNDISNMIAISESTPGPMGINMATFVGNNVGQHFFGTVWGGLIGAIISTLGEVAPSIIIIMIIARVLNRFKESKIVQWAFYGLRAVVIALIAYAAWGVYEVALFAEGAVLVPELIIFLILLAGMVLFKKVHPIIWIAAAAVIGIVMYSFF